MNSISLLIFHYPLVKRCSHCELVYSCISIYRMKMRSSIFGYFYTHIGWGEYGVKGLNMRMLPSSYDSYDYEILLHRHHIHGWHGCCVVVAKFCPRNCPLKLCIPLEFQYLWDALSSSYLTSAGATPSSSAEESAPAPTGGVIRRGTT